MTDKMKFVTLRNTKTNLAYTVKIDNISKKFILYIYDEKAKGIIRVVEVSQAYIFKLLLKN